MSAATMVVVPDTDGQHEKIVRNVVDGGLKTLDPKFQRRASDDQICTENIFQGVCDPILPPENILPGDSFQTHDSTSQTGKGAKIGG